MFTVALVGGDGAGKTTIAKALVESSPLPIKYMYMGISPVSTNVTLPTTRLAGLLRVRADKKEALRSSRSSSKQISTGDMRYRVGKRGPIWVLARTLNRLADFTYRELVSRRYHRQGYVVLYDRHILFETAGAGSTRLGRIQHVLLRNICAEPDMVIFLDAPAEVLYQRKGEATTDYLEGRRQVTLEQGKQMANFVRVDASRPFDRVLGDVSSHIMGFYESNHRHRRRGRRQPD